MAAQIAVSSIIRLNAQCNTAEKATAVSTINENVLQSVVSTLPQFSTSTFASASPINLPIQDQQLPLLELQLQQPSPTEIELSSTVPVRQSSRARRPPQRKPTSVQCKTTII
ncbi:hypothetical protein L914_05030 [Phytophthora nicotianae]|uniref:Uncharacterized protein n=1 Tax=Phytophthora nicotianae TaxID=4792 RepID=W2NQW6_PHYNI|nr:hypothetical protein L914_05030 [Phytophthora nicotianae]